MNESLWLSLLQTNSQAPEPLLKPRPDLGIVGVNDSLVGKANHRDFATKLSPPLPHVNLYECNNSDESFETERTVAKK